MSDTPIFAMLEWAAAQTAPWEGHQQALRLLEALVRGSVLGRGSTAPPGSCADGDAYLVSTPATGLWSGHEGEFAVAVGVNAANGWLFAPVEFEGFRLFVDDEDMEIEWRTDLSPSGWQDLVVSSITVDNDTTLASDSTVNPPSVHAVRGYVATAVTGLLDFKGSTDCSANPNYPAASKGDAYVVSVAGKIGGASGTSVDVGDVYVASADNAGGTQAAVGTSWFSLEHNAVASGLTAADASETNTGTSTTKAVTPDALAGSNFGIKTIQVLLADPAGSAVTTGDGKAFVRITSDLNGMNLVGCGAVLDTAGTGGGYLLQLRRKRSGSDVDMLSTRISIDSGENDSADAGTPPAINASNDDVATGDRIYFDRDGVPTGGKGDVVWMQFQLP